MAAAAAIADTFEKMGFKDVRLLTDATPSTLSEALKAFKSRARDADWAVVYFAGQSQAVEGKDFLVPSIDLQNGKLAREQMIRLEDLADATGGARQHHVVLVDVCRHSPTASKIDATILFSAKPGQAVLDTTLSSGAHSPFAAALIRHLSTPDRAFEDLVRRVREDTSRATGGKQEPSLEGASPQAPFSLMPADTGSK